MNSNDPSLPWNSAHLPWNNAALKWNDPSLPWKSELMRSRGEPVMRNLKPIDDEPNDGGERNKGRSAKTDTDESIHG